MSRCPDQPRLVRPEQDPEPVRTSLERLARRQGVDVEQMRAAVLNSVRWGTASTTIDVTHAEAHKVFELTQTQRQSALPDLRRARWLLHEEQRRWARVAGQPPGDSLTEAREQAAERARQTTIEGNEIRAGAWVYSRDVEEARRARTMAIIERARPGPFENGRILEVLAREAASIEMHLAPDPSAGNVGPALERVILGTTARPTSHASTAVRGDGVVVAISTGLVDFMYQTAKSIAMALKHGPSPPGVLTTVSARRQDTAARLATDDSAFVNFSDTMLNWLFRGTPWPKNSSLPPLTYQPVVGLLISGAERFVVAHEYGHALVDKLQMQITWEAPEPTEAEFRADCLGALAVFHSSEFDRVKPNIALQGAVLAMKAQEFIDRAIDVVRGGHGDTAAGSATHPPFADRLRKLVAFYEYLTDAQDDARLTVEALMVPADTAEMLWERFQPRLEKLLAHGGQLHPIWVAQLGPIPTRSDDEVEGAMNEEPADAATDRPPRSDEALVVVDPAEVEYVRALAAEHGVTVEVIDQDGFAGIGEVMIVIAGVSASVALVNDLIERRKGGQIFDLRPGALRLAHRSVDVQYGLVMIIAVDGKVTVEVKQPKTMFAEVIAALQEVILGMVKATVTAVADAARKASGESATVHTSSD